MITIFLIICIFFVGIWGLAVMSDLIQTVRAKFKNENYLWQSPNIFTRTKSWLSALLMSAMLICGIYAVFYCVENSIRAEYKENLTQCDLCENYFPEEYDAGDWDVICPYCAHDIILEYELLREDMYNTVIYEKGECFLCGDDCPSDLRFANDEGLCVNCATDILHNKKVAKEAQKYIDG